MKEQIRSMVADGNTESALDLLLQCGMQDALLLQSQYNGGKKNYSMGLIEYSEWQRILSRVNFAALELVNKLPANQPNSNPPYSQQTHQPIVMDNPLKRANQVFNDIQEDLNSYNFVFVNLQEYCLQLDKCLNAQICEQLLDFSKLLEWNSKTKSEKTAKIKETLEKLVGYKDKILARLKQHVEKQNDETSLLEALNLFRKKPNSGNWKLVYDLLFERFSDVTLFDPKVQQIWYKWDDKFRILKTELDWALDFEGSTDERDLWNFIQVNSQIKNFNYN